MPEEPLRNAFLKFTRIYLCWILWPLVKFINAEGTRVNAKFIPDMRISEHSIACNSNFYVIVQHHWRCPIPLYLWTFPQIELMEFQRWNAELQYSNRTFGGPTVVLGRCQPSKPCIPHCCRRLYCRKGDRVLFNCRIL